MVRRRVPRRARSLGIILVAVLTACGGGGASTSSGAVPGVQPPAGAPSPTPLPTSSVAPSRHFSTLPPGSALPDDATCAARVRVVAENKRMNAATNATRGAQTIPASFFSGDDARDGETIAPRIDGAYTGTTDEILQWAACKWGIDEDIVRAQAVTESWWRQTTLGDFGTDPTQCSPGHGLGVDGTPGQCPQSYGILQNRYPYEVASWPAIATSTAFNADLAYGIWRGCFEGYETWLNTVDRGAAYAAGDQWGCVGRWFAGRWHTAAADGYISTVQGNLAARTWQTANFQEP
jgi:autotransporter family porin